MSHRTCTSNTAVNADQLHYYHTDFYYSMPNLHKTHKMHGVKRVIVFCILIVILPATLIIIPLYLRKTVFADVTYPVAESDIIEIRDGISSIFCQQHTLRMSTNFNAFQLSNRPEISPNRKHIRLKKSMTLPDDTLEYWGFYLMKGAKVRLRFCSRYDGSKILVVKGARELNLCGLLDHNKNKVGTNYALGNEQVKVFFEEFSEFETLPTDLVDNVDKENISELENHGGEDFNNDADAAAAAAADDDIARQLQPTTAPVLMHTSKRSRKKLKKGTIHHTNAIKYAEQQHGAQNLKHSGSLVASQEEAHTRMSRHSRRSAELQRNAHAYRREQREAYARRKQAVYERLYSKERRTKRDHVYDRKYSHGGNAVNFTETDESNSVSSFETSLFECFSSGVLVTQGFPHSDECTNAHYLENGTMSHMVAKHDVTEDGYYYYIFYSDNDLVRNDIHAIFDIYKPTFQYSNISNTQGCVNTTNCTFSISFLSDEIVVVEVPTRDGIEHEEDDITNLISTCHPRTEIYALFPITVLILILCCSFL